jgi:hypothetical protein
MATPNESVNGSPNTGGNTLTGENELEFSLKKVRISKQVPGQIRLQQDVADCMNRAQELDLEVIKIDARNPLTASLKLTQNRNFMILVGRYYPHHPPSITSLPDGNRIRLPILDNWLPVHTIYQVIAQLRHYELYEDEMLIDS